MALSANRCLCFPGRTSLIQPMPPLPVTKSHLVVLSHPILDGTKLYCSASLLTKRPCLVGDVSRPPCGRSLFVTGVHESSNARRVSSDEPPIATDEGMVQGSGLRRLPGLRRADPVRWHRRRTIEPGQCRRTVDQERCPDETMGAARCVCVHRVARRPNGEY